MGEVETEMLCGKPVKQQRLIRSTAETAGLKADTSSQKGKHNNA